VGGRVEVKDGVVVHALAGGGEQRWRAKDSGQLWDSPKPECGDAENVCEGVYQAGFHLH